MTAPTLRNEPILVYKKGRIRSGTAADLLAHLANLCEFQLVMITSPVTFTLQVVAQQLDFEANFSFYCTNDAMTDSGVRPGDNYECVTSFTTRAELRFNDKIFGLSSESMMEIHLITSPIPQLQTPKGSAFQHKLLFRVIIFKILAKR